MIGERLTSFTWRGNFTNDEVNSLHAEALGTGPSPAEEWDWQRLVSQHSLGWVVARRDETLVGFVNVVWDGLTHAWVQDLMVDGAAQRSGVGSQLVARCKDAAVAAGCGYLHVDFEPHLEGFYIEACGFTPTLAGLMRL